MTEPTFAVVNLSVRVTDEIVEGWIAASNDADEHDFSLAWGILPHPMALYKRVEDVPKGMPLFLCLDTSDVPDAAAWHTEQNDGRITGVITVGPLLDAGWSLEEIQVAMSHEHREATKDPFVNVTVRMPNGMLDCFEMCDRVQGDSYDRGMGKVSNFLLPHAFDDSPPAGAKFDFMGVLKGPFDISPGGYASRYDTLGNPVQFGMMPEARRHTLGRSAQRARK